MLVVSNPHQQMFNTESLKTQITDFAKEKFRDVFPRDIHRLFISFKNKISSKHSWRIVIWIPFLLFIIGQLFHPGFLQFIPLPKETAMIIIDQRTTNLATIFSITLVVIGWLITNISIKEAISYNLLFKKTYIYPIFYYIIALIGCMMLCSLFRHWEMLNIRDAIISITYMILFALVCITFLFVRLIKVVGQNFFYIALESEIMKEIKSKAKKAIIFKKSNSLYKTHCEQIGFTDGIFFNTDLTNHNDINITPLAGIDDNTPMRVDSFFSPKKSYRIADIKLGIISNSFKSISLSGSNYYNPLGIGTHINEKYFPFYISAENGEIQTITPKIKKAYKLGRPLKPDKDETPNLDYLNERFRKDVKEGKKENVEMALAIYGKILELENRIFKEC